MTSPFGIMFVGIGIGLVLNGMKRWRRVGTGLIIFTLALIWVLGCNAFTRLVGIWIEGEETLPEHDSDAVAIVLLGGGMGAHDKCGRAEMFSGADRVWMASRQYQEYGGSLPIFCTGEGVDVSTKPLLIDLGVQKKDIFWFEEPRNTEEEARLIAAKIKECAAAQKESTTIAAKQKIVLVTSAWHMKRAKLLFEHYGFDVNPACTDYEMHCADEREWKFGDFIPSADAFCRNSYVLKEYVAIFCYKLKYLIN